MLTELETRLLGAMMAIIMLGMGASLTFKDFRIAFRKPQGILVGLACQYGIMPFLAYLIAVALDFPPALAIGLILIIGPRIGSDSWNLRCVAKTYGVVRLIRRAKIALAL
jgi:predicted Na+-dependent transporter